MLFSKNKNLLYSIAAITVLTGWLLSPLPSHRQASTEAVQVLIIDAGHGGDDGGAVAPNGTLESEINLDIALRLETLADFWGVTTVMTRTESSIAYPAEAETLSAKKKADQHARLDLIHKTPGAILISIHQNNYPSSSPWGIQVFYGAVAGSDHLASITQTNLTDQLSPENRRVASSIDSGIFLMREANCPAILVECGFLSNAEELAKLESETYRTELAAVMLASYLQYTKGLTT